MPTKSGVIGILAAALGRRRDESVEDLNALHFGVRIDIPGRRQNDFQTTKMGKGLNSNISTRVYLSDALFLVGLSCEDREFLGQLNDAINNPCFPLFLGRRSCPPTQPFNLGIRELDLYDALYNEPWLAAEWRREELFRFNSELTLRIVVDGSEGDATLKKDVPVSFSPYKRQYRYRYVREMPAKVITRDPSAESAEHDPMRELG